MFKKLCMLLIVYLPATNYRFIELSFFDAAEIRHFNRIIVIDNDVLVAVVGIACFYSNIIAVTIDDGRSTATGALISGATRVRVVEVMGCR